MRSGTPMISWGQRKVVRLWAATLLTVAALGPGCTSLPEGSPEIRQKALGFTPPPGKAGVYALGGRVPPTMVSLDALPFGTVQHGYYLYGAVNPGQHVVAVLSGEGSSHGSFLAEAGKNYFFVIGAGWVGCKVTDQLSDEKGKAKVPKLKLSGDSHFEFDEELKGKK